MNNILRLITFLSTLALISCATISSDWEEAKSAHTIPDYQKFIKKYKDNDTELRPYTSYTSAASMKINGLNEPPDWLKAKKINTIESYEAYVAQHTNKAHNEIARKKIDDFHWADVKKSATLLDYYFFTINYSKSKYAANARKWIDKQLASLKTINKKEMTNIKNEIEKIVLPFKIEELYNESMTSSNSQSIMSSKGSGNGVMLTAARFGDNLIIEKEAYRAYRKDAKSEIRVTLHSSSRTNYINVYHTDNKSAKLKLRIYDPNSSNSDEINYTLVEFMKSYNYKSETARFFCQHKKCYNISNLKSK